MFDKFLEKSFFFFILSYTQVDKYASKWCTVMTFWTLALAHVIKVRRKFLIRIVSKENQNEILLSFGQQMLAENQQFTTKNDNLQEGFIKMNVLSKQSIMKCCFNLKLGIETILRSLKNWTLMRTPMSKIPKGTPRLRTISCLKYCSLKRQVLQ